MADEQILRGTRLALAGAIWYLLEFAFILPFYQAPPSASSPVANLATLYTTHRTDLLIYVAGVSAAILGRLAFISGLRSALRPAEGVGPLLDLAFASSVVAVTVETVSLSLIGIAVSLATFGSEPSVVVAAALHNASSVAGSLVSVPYGLVALAASLAMLRTPILPRWIGWVGLAGGVAHCLFGNLSYFLARLLPALDTLQFVSWLSIVLWMLATGIVLFRRVRPVKAITRG